MKFEWENLGFCTRRAKVIGGWIVNVWQQETGTCECAVAESLVFVPDRGHLWGITEFDEVDE